MKLRRGNRILVARGTDVAGKAYGRGYVTVRVGAACARIGNTRGRGERGRVGRILRVRNRASEQARDGQHANARYSVETDDDLLSKHTQLRWAFPAQCKRSPLRWSG